MATDVFLCNGARRPLTCFLCVGLYMNAGLQAYFIDEETETRAILCRGKDRLVLAFRGTARVENLLTDLKFHQASSPSGCTPACPLFVVGSVVLGPVAGDSNFSVYIVLLSKRFRLYCLIRTGSYLV